jgi:hypothetical protein
MLSQSTEDPICTTDAYDISYEWDDLPPITLNDDSFNIPDQTEDDIDIDNHSSQSNDAYVPDAADNFNNFDAESAVPIELDPNPSTKKTLRCYWSTATPEEKDLQSQQGFQQIRDNNERVQLHDELSKQKQRSHQKELIRIRVANFRERKSAEKIAAGWVPGQKRVRVACFLCYYC